jgi:Dolichyl-phosphate-mannose-protein mannosyltransferase
MAVGALPRHWLFALVLVIAWAHALFYAMAMPPWNPVNEAQHLGYVLTLKAEHQPPHILQRLPPEVMDAVWRSESWKPYGLARPDTPERALGRDGRSFEGYQPPLYYLLMLPVATLAGGDPLRVMYAIRVASAVLLALLAGLAWVLTAHWFPREGALAPAGAALAVSALPVAASASARVSNDGLVAVLIAAGVVSVAALLEHPSTRRGLAAGAIAAAGLLTKSPGLLLVPVTLVALTILARQGRLSRRVALTALAPPVGAQLAWAGVTYARYGVPEGTWAFRRAYGTGFEPLDLLHFAWRLWKHACVPTPADYFSRGVTPMVMTGTLTLLVLVGVLGILRAPRPFGVIAVSGVLLGGLVALLWMANASRIVPPVSRVVLPAYPVVAALTAAGWARLLGSRAALVPAVVTWAVVLPYEWVWVVPLWHPAWLPP